MASRMFALEDLLRLLGGDPPSTAWMMLDHESSEGLPYDKADLEWQAGIWARGAAGTLKDDNVIRVFEDDVAGEGIRDDLLQVGQADLFLDGDQLPRRLQWYNLAVVSVDPGGVSIVIGRTGRKQAAQLTRVNGYR